ncbi:MAG TPA: hypothetical protein VGR21_10570, partial [Cryptosporangiaceae bacterium]|nr:hypothetical protein [Cryptosporangiaceae bacterium]
MVVSVDRWTGQEAGLLRAALRLSLRDFAAHLGVDIRTVSKWEARGAEVALRPFSQTLLDSTLLRAPEDAQRRFDSALEKIDFNDPIERDYEHEELADHLKRRTFLASGLAALSLPALTLDDLKHVVAAVEDSNRYMDREVVEHFRTQLRV